MKTLLLIVTASLMVRSLATQPAAAPVAQTTTAVSSVPSATQSTLSAAGAGTAPTGIGAGVAPTGIGSGVAPTGIGAGVAPSGIGQGASANGVAADAVTNGTIFATPGSVANDRRIQIPLFVPSPELGESTTGIPNGTSTSGALGTSTSGSLGRSTTGIGGAGISEIGTGFGANIVNATPAGAIMPITSALTNSLPVGGILSSNWRGDPIVIFPTPPPARPAGSREEFDADP